MGTKIVRRLSPEEEELASKRKELASLRAQLAEQELFLATARAEIAAFEARYLRTVGVLYAELDEWNARIAEIIAERESSEQTRSAATQARAQAQESYSAVHGEAAQLEEYAPGAELKSLYREVAKQVHPDLATDQADRERRERLMKAANHAYQHGEVAALRRILEEAETSPESVQGAGVAADLVRAIRQIRQLRNRLSEIEPEIAVLRESEIAKLKARAEVAKAQGRDLLAQMAADLTGKVKVARQRYAVHVARGATL